MQLRDYQQQIVNDTHAEFKKYNRPFIIQASTGAGKSHIIAAIANSLPNVLVLQPSKELLIQNHEKITALGTDAKLYSASVNTKEIGDITYATFGSIRNKLEQFRHFQYVIIDECDLGSKTTGTMIKYLDKMNAKVVGLTATPYRLENKVFYRDGQMVASSALKMLNRCKKPWFWGSIISKIETQELQEMGYLAPIKYYIDKTDTSGLKLNTTGRDYTTESMEKYGDRNLDRIVEVIKGIHERKIAKKQLVFCPTVSKAEKVSEALAELGITNAVVSAKTKKKDREAAVAGIKSGEIEVLLNCQVYIAGFDVPDLDCIVFARPTLSTRIWMQAIGRGIRIDPDNPDKVCKVFDLSSTYQSLGAVELIKLGKEDGSSWKDCLYGANGRIDGIDLYEFRIK